MKRDKMDDMEYIEDVKPEEIFKYCEDIKVNTVTVGKIIQINRNGIYVDIGSKTDGFIPAEEFVAKDLSKIFKIGDLIKVYIKNLNYNDVHLLSFRKAKEIELMDWLVKCHQEQIPIDANLLVMTDNGIWVDIGIEALLPFREMSKELKQKLKDNSIKFPIKVLIKEINQTYSKTEIIVSEKLYYELDIKQKKEKLFSTIKEGDIITGTVKTLTSFGAFIDIGGVDALLHISDLAWYKVDKLEDILHIGDKIKIKVLKVDYENEKISVGLKQLFPHPWENIKTKFSPGEIIKGKIVNITNFGLFVELEPGVEGLVHISEISWSEKNINLSKMFKLGQEITTKILTIDENEKRISLSIKKTLHNPWEDIKVKYPPGTKIKNKITKITPYGIFVLIEPGFEGMIHISDISWTEKIKNVHEYFKGKKEIECIVLDIIPEEERAVLSIKHLYPNPYQKYQKGKFVKCKIKKILPSSLIVEIEQNLFGIIKKSEAITDRREISRPLNQLYRLGQEIEAVVISSDETFRKIELSIKQMEKEIQKQLKEKYSSGIETPRLKDVLEES